MNSPVFQIVFDTKRQIRGRSRECFRCDDFTRNLQKIEHDFHFRQKYNDESGRMIANIVKAKRRPRPVTIAESTFNRLFE